MMCRLYILEEPPKPSIPQNFAELWYPRKMLLCTLIGNTKLGFTVLKLEAKKCVNTFLKCFLTLYLS